MQSNEHTNRTEKNDQEHGKAATVHTAKIAELESMSAFLDSLIPITLEQIQAAHARSAYANERAAGLVAQSFREGQQGIYKYIPYTDETPRQEAHENGALCAYTRRLCLVLLDLYGWVPVLKTEDLLEIEPQAKAILAKPLLRPKIRSLGVLLPIVHGMVGIAPEHKFMEAPDREKQLLKILCIWICFSRVYEGITPIKSNTQQADNK